MFALNTRPPPSLLAAKSFSSRSAIPPLKFLPRTFPLFTYTCLVSAPFVSLAPYRHRFVIDESGYDACRLASGPDDCGCPASSLIHQPLPPLDYGRLATFAAFFGLRLPRGPRWGVESLDCSSFRSDIQSALERDRQNERFADGFAFLPFFPRPLSAT